jgi:DNA repair protein RecO (recombination protein O)
VSDSAARFAAFDDGLILRLVPYGESDQVATLFTRAHGRITALARGARRSKRRFGGALGHLVVSQLGLRARTRGELWTLESAQVLEDFTALAADVAAFAHAGYATELLLSLTPAEVAEPALLDLAIALHRCLRGGASAGVLRAFELHLLDVIGSGPVLEACVACGAGQESGPTRSSYGVGGGTADLDEGAVFDPVRGGVVCRRCAPQSRGPSVRPLPPGARAHLVAARQVTDLPAARALEADEAARDAMLAMITHLVGRPLRAVEFIAKLRSRLDP